MTRVSTPHGPSSRAAALLVLGLLVALMLGAGAVSYSVQRDFGNVEVKNVYYHNRTGTPMRAKLYRPGRASPAAPVPGIIYVHGYQNNRETSDPFCIEHSRRGFAALCIDAIGRGNSGLPLDPDDPGFDTTFGVEASLRFFKSLDFVDPERIGLLGNSLGAELAYELALRDPSVKALVISGFAYDDRASFEMPRNMLMIFGKWDEFRDRMTGTGDVEAEWMGTKATRAAIRDPDPKIGRLYGRFEDGTARMVLVPRAPHLMVAHSAGPIAAALDWMRQALGPEPAHWVPPDGQTWHIKELATLVALAACLLSLIPFGWLLLCTRFFKSLLRGVDVAYTCPRPEYLKSAAINGALMWLYLPLFFVLYGIHLYVIRVDRAFPMMIVNGIVWWFFVINAVGFALFVRWYKKKRRAGGPTLEALGVSFQNPGFGLDARALAKTLLLSTLLFGFSYGLEYATERLFLTDLRFILPFASDLTAERALLMPRYFPFILLGFVQVGLFLHVQLCRPPKSTWLKTFFNHALVDTAVLAVPLLLFLSIQYVPLFATGFIPFTGPGGSATSFLINLIQVVCILLLVVPLSTWFHQLTGRPYLGAAVNAFIVTWMFASSQVVAPVPV